VAGAVGLASLGAYVATRNELRDEIDAFLVRRSDELLQGQRDTPQRAPSNRPGRGGESRNGEDGQSDQEGDGGAADEEPNLPFEPDAVSQLIAADGTVEAVSGTIELPVDGEDQEIAASGDPRRPRVRSETVAGEDYRILTVPQQDGGALMVGRSLAETGDVLDGLTRQLAVIAGAGGVVAGAIGWLVARQTTAPLRRLSTAAHRVAATQDLAEPVPVGRQDEVGSLARSFNTMLGGLDTSRRQQHQRVLHAGHELRTPLTSLRTAIELLQRGERLAPEERARLLDRAEVELAELTNLVTEVIELATETRAADEPEQEVDLGALVEEAAESSRRRTGRVIEVEAGGAAVLVGRPGQLERVVCNLLANAHKFSPADAPVRVVADGGGWPSSTGAPASPKPSGSTCSTGSPAPTRRAPCPGRAWGWPSCATSCSSPTPPGAAPRSASSYPSTDDGGQDADSRHAGAGTPARPRVVRARRCRRHR
jgi:two-component system sensor histidine kinase MprB